MIVREEREVKEYLILGFGGGNVSVCFILFGCLELFGVLYRFGFDIDYDKMK